MKKVRLKELSRVKLKRGDIIEILDSFKDERDSVFIILGDVFYEKVLADHKDIIIDISKNLNDYHNNMEQRKGHITNKDSKFVAGHIIDDIAIFDLMTIKGYAVAEIIEILLNNGFSKIFSQAVNNKHLIKYLW